jgi:hypothetical protein
MAGQQASDGWPEVVPDPRDSELILRDGDTVTHWMAVYREHIENSKKITAATDLGMLATSTSSARPSTAHAGSDAGRGIRSRSEPSTPSYAESGQ